jgi:hypothetical protein
MGKYRTSTLDLPTRIEIVAEMMLPVKERGWGRVTELAREHGVSRTRWYQLKEKAQAVCQCAPYNVPGSCTHNVPPSCTHNVPPWLW